MCVCVYNVTHTLITVPYPLDLSSMYVGPLYYSYCSYVSVLFQALQHKTWHNHSNSSNIHIISSTMEAKVEEEGGVAEAATITRECTVDTSSIT